LAISVPEQKLPRDPTMVTTLGDGVLRCRRAADHRGGGGGEEQQRGEDVRDAKHRPQ
jgi:hypothetical protein